MRCVTECSAILGKDAYFSVMNYGKVVVGAGKGDPLCMMKEIQVQINSLQEQASNIKGKPSRSNRKEALERP